MAFADDNGPIGTHTSAAFADDSESIGIRNLVAFANDIGSIGFGSRSVSPWTWRIYALSCFPIGPHAGTISFVFLSWAIFVMNLISSSIVGGSVPMLLRPQPFRVSLSKLLIIMLHMMSFSMSLDVRNKTSTDFNRARTCFACQVAKFLG